MTSSLTSHPLDNILWNALTTKMSQFGTGTALAKRFGDIAVAIADHSDAAYAELASLVAPGETPILMDVESLPAVPGFSILQRQSLLEMVCAAPPPIPESGVEVRPLTLADADDIAALVDLTKPGPFWPEMMAMGPFIGIRIDGQLAAVSAQRLHVTGYREVSTVCTHPDFQGRGYAGLLVSRIANEIFAGGETPFLHVLPDNIRAQSLYERLGFYVRKEMTLMVVARSS